MIMDLETRALAIQCRKEALKTIALDSRKWSSYARKRRKSAKKEMRVHAKTYASENRMHAIY